MAKEVAGYGVVPGLRRFAEEWVRRDYDPARDGGGSRGDVPERWLPVTSMPLAPRSAIPIPEKFLSNCAARHERVLFSTVLAFTSNSPTGWDGKASKNMPAQLSWIVFPAKEPRWVSVMKMPHGPPETLLPTTFAFTGFGPSM